MIGYNPSHLNKNETLLEAFHRVEAYLKANPQYQVYQSSATYQEGTQEYALNTIIVPEGSTVGKGDVVLFSNVYYAVITAVSETTFSIETATNFRGAQGEQGRKGDTGATGAKGETGLPALMYSKNLIYGNTQTFYTVLDGYNRPPQINDSCVYVSSNTDLLISGTIQEIKSDTQQAIVKKVSSFSVRGPQGPAGPEGQDGKDGNATLLYAGELSESITTAEKSQVTRPQNRGILVKDILISTAASTFGAMAQVTALPVGVTTVTVSFIGTLESGGGSTAYHKLGESGGGTTLNKYEWTITYGFDNTKAKRLSRIYNNSKGRVEVFSFDNRVIVDTSSTIGKGDNEKGIFYCHNEFYTSEYILRKKIYCLNGNITWNGRIEISENGSVSNSHSDSNPIEPTRVVYYNDTEIT